MFRVPDNRPNERTTKGEQPYDDERETFARNREEIEEEAEQLAERAGNWKSGGSERRLEEDAEERFEEIAEQASKNQAD